MSTAPTEASPEMERRAPHAVSVTVRVNHASRSRVRDFPITLDKGLPGLPLAEA